MQIYSKNKNNFSENFYLLGLNIKFKNLLVIKKNKLLIINSKNIYTININMLYFKIFQL
jgi:hypothetical protein